MLYNYFIKSTKFLYVFLLLLMPSAYSQCTEFARDFGNNNSISSYNISGDVSVTLNNDNTVTLDLASNFRTASGPDVRAYLINSEGLSDSELTRTEVRDIKSIQFGLVACNECSPEIEPNGEKSFTMDIPSDVNIKDYDKVLFYCLEFDAFWDFGTITPFQSSSCDVLSTEEVALQNITVSPNPASTTIELSNVDTNNAEIRIFDLSGKNVFLQKKKLFKKLLMYLV